MLLLLFSRSVVSNSLQPHGRQHTRLPCSSRYPGVYSNSCSLSWWCHPTTSSSTLPSPPAFKLSQHQGLFQWVNSASASQKYWSFSFSNSPFNKYSGLISFRMDWFDLISVQETLKHFSSTSLRKHQSFGIHLSLWSHSHPNMTTGKMIALTKRPLLAK